MSAIAGVYLLDGSSVNQKDLKRMKDCLSHRGPDGSGLWSEGSVGLAHQMLWTTPESLREKLPLEADSLVITADARIDNRDELIPALGLSKEASDSEVILKAFERWGRSCVDKLLGDFAFVVWDRAKGELFCVRDHMGVKPFYYYYQPDEIFAFATELKALLAWGVPRRINEVRIGDYLAMIIEDREITFYQDILRLPPANFIVISPNDLRKEQYWELDPKREIRLGSDEEYERAFRDIFREAVRCRLRSAFPVGSMLSGGLDSSSIVCMARELLPKDRPLKTFSAVFNTVKECDERPYIEAVLAGGDLEAHYIYGDKIGPLTDIDSMLWHEDQPFFMPNLFLNWAIYQEARSKNVRIIFDGFGGDSAVSYGKTYITELAGKGRLVYMLKEAKDMSRIFRLSSRHILLQYAFYPFIPDSLRQLWRMLRGLENDSMEDIKIANSDFVERIDLKDRRNALEVMWSKPARTARDDHWHQLASGIIPLVLEVCNMAAAAFSIEVRNPFLDKRLLEFCLALPGDQKLRRGWTRSIMRRALRNVLPNEIFCRSNKGILSQNFTYGLRSSQQVLLENVIFNGKNKLGTYVNVSDLHGSYQRLISHEELPEDMGFNIWLVTILALWFELNAKPSKSIYLIKK